MGGIEFSKKGPEGLGSEGVDETKGWASLKKVPFAGEDMAEQADRINEVLKSIDLPEFEGKQGTQSKGDVNIDNLEQESRSTQDNIQKQIDFLKANLPFMFGGAADSTNNNNRGEQPRGSSDQDKNQSQIEPVIQEQKTQEAPVEQEESLTSETESSVEADDESSLKNEAVNQIISKMIDAGEFQNSGLDISQKMWDIEYAKKKLQDKTLEELQILLSTYE